MIDVMLTKDFRLTADSHNFIVMERHIVDSTKAPGYKPPEDGTIPPTREEWRDLAWYGLNPESLALCIDFVVIRTAARSDAQTLGELAATIREEYRLATDAINAAIQPPEELWSVTVADGVLSR